MIAMIKNSSFRQCISLLMCLGLLWQFQTVYACDMMDNQPKTVCCCDQSGDVPIDCSATDNNAFFTDSYVSQSDCCVASYQALPSATSIPAGLTSHQVILLDAPQPPPVLVSFYTPEHLSQIRSFSSFTVFTQPYLSGTQTYLLTNRFRI